MREKSMQRKPKTRFVVSECAVGENEDREREERGVDGGDRPRELAWTLATL